MIVMKFGGSSVADAPSIERVVNIIQRYESQNPIVVVSAMGKTTKKLLRAAELAASGMLMAGLDQLDELKNYHAGILEDLWAAQPEVSHEGRLRDYEQHVHEGLELITGAKSDVEGYFNEIENLLNGLSILHEFTPRGRDRIASYGELISSVIVAYALKRGGVNAVWLDAREFIVTDDSHTRARPLFEIANPKIVATIQPCIGVGQIPITQGYIGSTIHGVTTTLGFEGSDYTAAVIGAAMEADDIQIWTDVNGVMTADPAVLPAARTIKTISFIEAKELTHFGAKVLHPKTLFPAHEKNIPIHIFNSKQPDALGTVITTKAPPSRTPVKSIAYRKPVSLVMVASNGASHRLRFFKAVFDALERADLFTYIASVSELSLALAIDPSDTIEGFMNELCHEAQISVTTDHAIVCVVGENLKQLPAVSADVFQALKDVHFDLISQGASEHSLVLIVKATEVEPVLKRLHDLLFQNPDPEIFV